MLGELLELLHTSQDRWQALSAGVRDWQDLDGLSAAADRLSSDIVGGPAGTPPGSPRTPGCTGVVESELTVTAVSAGPVRVGSRTGDEQELLIVHPDGQVLTVDRDGVADSEDGRPLSVAWVRLDLVGLMLAPAVLAGVCRLTEPGAAQVAGRDCLTTRAVLRPDLLGHLPYLLGYGIHQADLAVDTATGLVLRVAAVDDADRRLHTVEVEWLELNPSIDPDAFSLQLPPGAIPRPPERIGPVTIREAAAAAPFTLFAPTPTADDYPWAVLLTAGRRGRPVTAHLHQLGRRVQPGRLGPSILESGALGALPEVSGWTPLQLGGLVAHVWASDGLAHLVAWQEGTGIWIQGAASVDAAQRLLESLHAVPTDGQ
jgi:hypothetical protein